MFISINGEQHYLWRAVDQDGTVLDLLVRRRRNKAAVRKFFRRLLKALQYVRRAVLPGIEHRRHTGRKNRAENAHQPTRERERRMRRFKSPGHAQRSRAATG